MRRAAIDRRTAETQIYLRLSLDGRGEATADTGCGFLNHMLVLFARHAAFDLEVFCKGDREVDYHHSTEDIGICLGQAFKNALGDKRGINRYGDALLPMDEALLLCALDISGRGSCHMEISIPSEKVGDFDTELCEEFFIAFARESGINLHVRQLAGKNSHHIMEGIFKGTARALRTATAIDASFADSIPSTKGIL